MPIELPEQPDKPLSARQFAAWQAFRDLLSDPDEPDRLYNAFPESQGGKIISTDIARHLDADYHNTPPGQPRDLAPGDDLAWRYSWDRLAREIRNKRNRQTICFMAGGWAAGKTHALEHRPTTPDLVWDGTLANTPWTVEMIDLALSQGWEVEIIYVFRDLELAFYGAMERAASEGRSVPLGQLPRIHRQVQQSINNLRKFYFSEDRVTFAYLHNFGTKDLRLSTLEFSESDLEPAGALHYSETYEAYYIRAAARFANAEVERLGERGNHAHDHPGLGRGQPA
jgi:hypothetical protein